MRAALPLFRWVTMRLTVQMVDPAFKSIFPVDNASNADSLFPIDAVRAANDTAIFTTTVVSNDDALFPVDEEPSDAAPAASDAVPAPPEQDLFAERQDSDNSHSSAEAEEVAARARRATALAQSRVLLWCMGRPTNT